METLQFEAFEYKTIQELKDGLNNLSEEGFTIMMVGFNLVGECYYTVASIRATNGMMQ